MFTTEETVTNHTALKEVFNVDSDENDEKKNEDGDKNPLQNPQSKPLVKNVKKGIKEESKEDQMRHGSCSGCLVQ